MSRNLIVVDKVISDYYGKYWFEHNFKYRLGVSFCELVNCQGSNMLVHTDAYLKVIEKLIRGAGNEAFIFESNFEKEEQEMKLLYSKVMLKKR